MSLPPDQKPPVVEPSPEPAAQLDSTARSLRVRIRQQEILAGLGVLALKAIVTPTRAMPCDANGQPPRENRMAEITTARNARSPFRIAARRER